jgi:hypothetical protein
MFSEIWRWINERWPADALICLSLEEDIHRGATSEIQRTGSKAVEG